MESRSLKSRHHMYLQDQSLDGMLCLPQSRNEFCRMGPDEDLHEISEGSVLFSWDEYLPVIWRKRPWSFRVATLFTVVCSTKGAWRTC